MLRKLVAKGVGCIRPQERNQGLQIISQLDLHSMQRDAESWIFRIESEAIEYKVRHELLWYRTVSLTPQKRYIACFPYFIYGSVE